VTPGGEPFLHPGRAATVQVGEEAIGWLGEIHPLVAADWEIEQAIATFELDLDLALESAPELTTYEDLTSFPSVREDLAVVVPESVSAAEVVNVVRGAGAALLSAVEVFDVYRDEQRLGSGNVSLALRLTYRAPDRTLTDAEVASVRSAIAEALARELDGRVRDA
jgi:phenylalanyl-tRNA synthetase beta chain